MREAITKVYKFDELSDKAKEKALQWYREGAFDYDWYKFIYEDAENIGLEIDGFDIYHGTISGSWIKSPYEALKLILENHGEECDTYKTAAQYEKQFLALGKDEDGEQVEDENLEDDFRNALLEDYLVLLRKELEYLESDEACSETIRSNEYEFTENGKIF